MRLNEMTVAQRKKEGYIKGAIGSCLMCGQPTPFIEVYSEAHFCSVECANAFYEQMQEKDG